MSCSVTSLTMSKGIQHVQCVAQCGDRSLALIVVAQTRYGRHGDAQRMLEMFMTHKWVVRRQLNYFKYQEKLERSAGNAAARLGFRDPNAADPDDLI